MIVSNENIRGCKLTSFIIKGRDKTEHSVAQTQNKHNITYSEGAKRKTKWYSLYFDIPCIANLPLLSCYMGCHQINLH